MSRDLQHHDRNDIQPGRGAHPDVAQGPRIARGSHGAHHNRHHHQHPKPPHECQPQPPAVNPPVEIGQVGFRHVVVGQHRGEGEQPDRHRNEARADAAGEAIEAFLNEAGPHGHAVGKLTCVTHRAVLALVFEHLIHVGGNDDKRGRRAHKQRIHVHGKRLHEPLFCRVRHLGGGRRLRTGALTGLVGIDAALDAPHDGGAQHPGEHGLLVECGPEDQGKHVVNPVEIHKHDHDRRQDVHHRHERHHQGGEVRDPPHPTHDDDRQQDPQHHRTNTNICSPSIMHGSSHPIGLNSGEEIRCGQHHRHGEHHRIHQHELPRPGVLIRFLNVVGGPAPILAGVPVLLLINLGERAFDKRRGRPQQRHRPHPKHGPRATERNGGGHPRNIPHANPAGQGDHQGFKGGHPGTGFFIAHNLPHHVGQAPNLKKQRGQGEINPHRQTQEHQCRRPNNAIEGFEECSKTHGTSPFFVTRNTSAHYARAAPVMSPKSQKCPRLP